MKRILFFILLIAAWACNEAEPLPNGDESIGGMTSFRLEVSGDGNKYETRSILSEENIEGKVTEVTLAAYDGNGALVGTSHYKTGQSTVSMNLGANSSCHVYALANMGDMSGRFPASEDRVKEMEYMLSSYQDVGTRGIPMCDDITVTAGSQDNLFSLERLFARITVNIRHSRLADSSTEDHYAYNLCNKSLYVRQANSRMRPFAPEGSRAEAAADILALSDYNPDLNDMDTYEGPLEEWQLGPGPGYLKEVSYVLYVPENVQGPLLEGNTDPFGKVPENLSPAYRDICTYLEFNAVKENSMGYSGNLMYRYYLGADNTTDFSVERNSCYELNLDFTEEGFFVDSWKVTREGWEDNRTLDILEDSYKVLVGGKTNVMVHFNRNISDGADSEPFPDRWEYEFDEEAMRRAGLTVSFDPNTLVTGKNGHKDFCFEVSASEDADTEASFTMMVRTTDGTIEDRAVLRAVEPIKLPYSWDKSPEYVSQYGILSVSGYEESDLPLSISVSDESKLSCEALGNGSFKVKAIGKGESTLKISSCDGFKAAVVPLTILAPVLKLDNNNSQIELSPDGAAVSIGFEYLDFSGSPIQDVDNDAWESSLKPVVSNSPYFDVKVTGDSFEIFVSRLYGDDGVQIEEGSIYNLELVPANCPDALSQKIKVKVTDPFVNVTPKKYGSLDDYTLFGLSTTDPDLRERYAYAIVNNVSVELGGDKIVADPNYVRAELVPKYSDDYTHENGVFRLDWLSGSGNMPMRMNPVYASTKHSAGPHDVMIMVENRHSGERIGVSYGTLDIYVHTAIGAEARFDKSRCCDPVGDRTFADVYNDLRLTDVYPYPNSTDYIYYMDVTMKFMTDVSGVLAFEKLRDNDPEYDAETFLRPSRNDGDLQENLLISIDNGEDDREEPAGERFGMERMLYRALLTSTYDHELTTTNLRDYFFGYKYGRGGTAYAPSFRITDNISTKYAYYFTPSKFSDHHDKNGQGYYVIHFLEEIESDTCNWIYLY